jgi:signal transduction histidine kinase
MTQTTLSTGPEAVQELRAAIDRLAPSEAARQQAHQTLTAVLAEHDGEWCARQDKVSLKYEMTQYARSH